MKLLLLAALLTSPLFGASASTNLPTHVYQTRGLIREIAPDGTTAVIRHENIPGYMPPMTMELNVRDTNELRGLVAGDTITFRLSATDDTHWIDQLKKVAGPTNAPAPPAPAATSHFTAVKELGPGDLIPDATFAGEHGRPVRFADFRGQAVAFTFFFTRCPLPDYCPLMNKNFSGARRLLQADAHAPTNWTLLCISFDAEFDSAAVLASYARLYRGDDTNRWLFASASAATLKELAPQLDLAVQRDGPGFSHNLRTVVLDPRGRIHRQFDGNRWKAEELAAALRAAAVVAPAP